jgi:hypothetical protein
MYSIAADMMGDDVVVAAVWVGAADEEMEMRKWQPSWRSRLYIHAAIPVRPPTKSQS